MIFNAALPVLTRIQSVPNPQGALLRLRLIGHMEARTASGESVLPPGRKTRGLLAMVVLAAPRPIQRGRLAETFWSRRPEEQARASLRQEIHRLLEALGPIGEEVFVVSRDHLSVRAGSVWVDVEDVLRASAARPASLSLFDGELLEDLDGLDPVFDSWLVGERERLRDRARTVAEALLREQQDPEEAIAAAQRLLSIDRAHEGAWRVLVQAHAERGERGMAMEAYERCRSALADLLDAQPSDEMQQLVARIKMGAGSKPAAGIAAAGRGEPAPPQTAMELRSPASRAGFRVPRLGVLAPQWLGAAAGDEPLATGLAEEMTTSFACCRSMVLVSHSALARFAAETRDEAAIRRAFGIDFLLDGTIQRANGSLRVNLRLIDLRAGNQVVWARRFDGQSRDPLALQDEIAAQMAAQIDAQILLSEAHRLTRPPRPGVGRVGQAESQGATAPELLLRALPLIGILDREQFAEAGDLLARAIAAAPDCAAAHAWSACWQLCQIAQNWTGDAEQARRHAGELAERAILLDPLDPANLTIAGHVRACLYRQPREAIALHARALALNPYLALAWNFSGQAYAWLGDLEEAERRIRRYKTLAPFYPCAAILDTPFVAVALLKREHEQAVALAREIGGTNPTLLEVCKPWLAALGHLGPGREAADVLRRLHGMEPGFTIRGFLATSPFEREKDRDHYAAGLRKAGTPEGAD